MRGKTVVAIVVATLACGIPLWPLAYDRVSLPGNPTAPTWLLGSVISGAIAAMLLPGFGRPTLCVAAGFVLAVMGRVAVETARDPTSHNLWPFEVVIAAGFGLVGGVIGALVVRVASRLRRGET